MNTYTKSHKKYYQKNTEKIKLKKGIYDRMTRDKYRESVFEILGLRCKICGFNDLRALHIDHINGGGQKERKLQGGGQAYHKIILSKIMQGVREYQILCANCNFIKEHELRKLRIYHNE